MKIETQIKSDADKARVGLLLGNLKLDEGPYRLRIEKDRETRSQKQNRLYRKWLKIISEELGHSTEDLAYQMREKFLVMKLYNSDDLTKRSVDALRELKSSPGNQKYYLQLKEVLVSKISTAQMNTKQFTEYLGEIQQWALDKYGIILPVPDDLRIENLTITTNKEK